MIIITSPITPILEDASHQDGEAICREVSYNFTISFPEDDASISDLYQAAFNALTLEVREAALAQLEIEVIDDDLNSEVGSEDCVRITAAGEADVSIFGSVLIY